MYCISTIVVKRECTVVLRQYASEYEQLMGLIGGDGATDITRSHSTRATRRRATTTNGTRVGSTVASGKSAIHMELIDVCCFVRFVLQHCFL